MSGLECSEILLSQIDLGDRYDAEYFSHRYLDISNKLEKVNTFKLGDMSSIVASAFYPAATHLYEIGSIPFIRCVDSIDYPMVTNLQEDKFKRIPEYFIEENTNISIISHGDIIITKVGTPCYASLLLDYEKVALSRTVLGVTKIDESINRSYLMVFLRSKYGFEQLKRQRELTIQYQLTLDRVRNIDVFIPSTKFQSLIHDASMKAINKKRESINLYNNSEKLLLQMLGLSDHKRDENNIAIKMLSESFLSSGRLDAEYYQPKYDEIINAIKKNKYKKLGEIVKIKKSIEPGRNAYQEYGIPFVRVADLTKYEITMPEIYLDRKEFEIEELKPKKDTILLTKDGSCGIAYKVDEDMDIITSGAILHLKVNDSEILPDYLTLVLNSITTKMQAERDAGGSVIQHWKPSEIEEVLIPILPLDIQKEIDKDIIDSYKLRKESKDLFEKAKRAVEIAIEYGEEQAIKYLSE